MSIEISTMGKPIRLAVVCDPKETEPPSTHETLAYLLKVAEKLEVEATLQGLDKLNLSKFDAVFIRQTTYPGAPIHAMAARAQAAGVPCIPSSLRQRLFHHFVRQMPLHSDGRVV